MNTSNKPIGRARGLCMKCNYHGEILQYRVRTGQKYRGPGDMTVDGIYERVHLCEVCAGLKPKEEKAQDPILWEITDLVHARQCHGPHEKGNKGCSWYLDEDWASPSRSEWIRRAKEVMMEMDMEPSDALRILRATAPQHQVEQDGEQDG